MKWFWEHYLDKSEDAENPSASSLRAKEFGQLPPATVITAEIDPLRSEGQAYADKLRAAGVKVETVNYDGVAHEFFGMGAVVDKAKDAVRKAADGLRSDFDAKN